MIGFLGDACISANGMRSTWATGPPSQSTRTFAGKKNPRSKDLGQNPPKEEGGGDNLGMSGYESISPRDRVIRKPITFRHPITEVYRSNLCIARTFLLRRDISLLPGVTLAAFRHKEQVLQLAITLS